MVEKWSCFQVARVANSPPMLLEGSCHCRAVTFRVSSRHPYPFNRCYCSICRKTAGAGGFAINIEGDCDTFEVDGGDRVRFFHARISEPGEPPEYSRGRRHFCGDCGSPLWVWDPRWPEMVHPHASAIDTPLPAPPERTHLMLGSRAPWVEPEAGGRDRRFERYPDESIAAWHDRLGLSED
jgi:hypothetical protein